MATLETQHLDEVIASSRRKMLTLGGAALAGLAFTSVAKAQATTTPYTDADYLNFALNLEYLEANFYTLAASGTTIDTMGVALTGTGTQGVVTVKPGGFAACKVNFKNALVAVYAAEIAQEERNHVTFLRSALNAGTTPAAVAQPAIDLYNSFNALAGLLGLSITAFDPFADDASFLLGSYIFEDVGVTAYTGAAPLLTTPAYLDAAAGIQAVEAYHAGIIRTSLVGLDQSSNTVQGQTAPAGTLGAIATAISKLRASVDGSMSTNATNTQGDDIGIGLQQVMLNGTTSLTASTLVDASTTGSINAAGASGTAGSLVFARTGAEVLPIVYAGGTAASNMGFFRSGLNGNIK